MRFGPLTLFSRTSDRRVFELAGWHSPHSMTWLWVLSLHRQCLAWPKPYLFLGSGLTIGLGQMIGLHVSRSTAGWHWSVSLLWHALYFTPQKPMWYRDMFRLADADRAKLRSAGNIETLCEREFTDGVSPGAAARQMCRSLPRESALRTMLEAMLASANRASFDRSCILRDFADADPEAASEAEMASFRRINVIADPPPDGPPAGVYVN